MKNPNLLNFQDYITKNQMNISTGVFRGVLNLNLRGWPDDQPALCIMDFKNNHPPIRGLVKK